MKYKKKNSICKKTGMDSFEYSIDWRDVYIRGSRFSAYSEKPTKTLEFNNLDRSIDRMVNSKKRKFNFFF